MKDNLFFILLQYFFLTDKHCHLVISITTLKVLLTNSAFHFVCLGVFVFVFSFHFLSQDVGLCIFRRVSFTSIPDVLMLKGVSFGKH